MKRDIGCARAQGFRPGLTSAAAARVETRLLDGGGNRDGALAGLSQGSDWSEGSGIAD